MLEVGCHIPFLWLARIIIQLGGELGPYSMHTCSLASLVSTERRTCELQQPVELGQNTAVTPCVRSDALSAASSFSFEFRPKSG